ncbi:MAG: putative metalloprotease CJM1_0395 family protein [Gemmatimonadetes bacterium]|nr:putative metalloprotease CJM1_0395 family protein [Gemmatimonadota bacterium]
MNGIQGFSRPPHVTDGAARHQVRMARAKRELDTRLSSTDKVVQELQVRDREVRAHEAAHQSAGGSVTGGAKFTFVVGPDGRRYAVGGEVSIDVSAVPGEAEATIQKMQTVIRAALAPANPSSQDQAVAATARAIAASAQQQLSAEHAEEGRDDREGTNISRSDIVGTVLDVLA